MLKQKHPGVDIKDQAQKDLEEIRNKLLQQHTGASLGELVYQRVKYEKSNEEQKESTEVDKNNDQNDEEDIGIIEHEDSYKKDDDKSPREEQVRFMCKIPCTDQGW